MKFPNSNVCIEQLTRHTYFESSWGSITIVGGLCSSKKISLLTGGEYLLAGWFFQSWLASFWFGGFLTFSALFVGTSPVCFDLMRLVLKVVTKSRLCHTIGNGFEPGSLCFWNFMLTEPLFDRNFWHSFSCNPIHFSVARSLSWGRIYPVCRSSTSSSLLFTLCSRSVMRSLSSSNSSSRGIWTVLVTC